MRALLPGASPALEDFLAESPLNRPHIAGFVQRAAESVPPGSRVLDAGAGAAPYRELFSGHDYRTTDWAGTPHAEGLRSDVVAPIEALPLPDASFDLAVCTEVIEHVVDPVAALTELRRVLAPGGHLWLTAPFVWEHHEEPHDYFRYTHHGMRSVAERAGFEVLEVVPFGGCFSTVAQLLRGLGGIAGQSGAGARPLPRLAGAGLARAAPALARLDRLDRRGVLPIGHGVVARR